MTRKVKTQTPVRSPYSSKRSSLTKHSSKYRTA